jgi:hypothetical protein
MSELMNQTSRGGNVRWQTLATVSTIALLTCASARAQSESDERPTVWIEIGGQLDHIDGGGDRLVAPFMLKSPTPGPFKSEGSPIAAQRPARYSYGGEGKLTFQPETSDWTFSAAVRYGRSSSKRYVHQQTQVETKFPNPVANYYPQTPYITKYSEKFTDNTTSQSESHMVLDFQAGRDVGLGLFGRETSSVLSVGVRFAQFSSRAQATIYARPDVDFYPFGLGYFVLPLQKFPTYFLQANAKRSFHGIGPSLSWNASVPFAGNKRRGELSFDWGIDGAVLFGRQKARISHKTINREFGQKYHVPAPTPSYLYHTTSYKTIYHHTPPDQVRSRSVTVPNVGLTAAVSYRVENFKATLGYRADFFFGAVDSGWDVRRTTDLTFHGPFLNFSLGLGG